MGIVWDTPPAEPQKAPDQPGLVDVAGSIAAKQYTEQPLTGAVADEMASRGTYGRMLSDFGQGAGDNWGSKNFLDEYAEFLHEKDKEPANSVLHSQLQAINEAAVRPAVMSLSVGLHGITSLFAGTAATGPGGREIASMPEAFMGNPGNLMMEGALARQSLAYRRLKPKLPDAMTQDSDILGVPETIRSKAKAEQYTIFEPLGGAEGETMPVQILRDKDGSIDALLTPYTVAKVAPAHRGLSPEQAIAETLGDHPQGGTADPSKVKAAPEGQDLFARPERKVPERMITGGVHDEPNIAVAKDMGVIGPPKPTITEGTPAEAAKNAVVPTTAYHGSPYSFDAFSSDKIGTGEGAQTYGYGHYLAENPAVSTEYIPKNKYKADTPESMAALFLDKNPDRAKAIEAARSYIEVNRATDEAPIYEGALKLLESDAEIGPVQKEGNHYTVRIHADQTKMLDWDKPISEQHPAIQQLVKDLGLTETEHGLPIKTGADVYHALSDVVKSGKKLPPDANGFYKFDDGRAAASNALAEAGIPGIRYLDQGSRGASIEAPTHIASRLEEIGVRQDQIKGLSSEQQTKVLHAEFEALDTEKAGLQSELKQYRHERQTRNFVAFNDKDIEITHKNGIPVAQPERALVPSAPREVTPEETAWQARFEKSVSKLSTTAEAKNIILEAANRQDLGPARRGDIPAAHMDALMQASGARPGQIDPHATSILLKNDQATEAAVQAMLKASDDVASAAADLRTAKSTENRIAFQEAILRRNTIVDAAVEQYVGRRAQWGREGNALQKYMETVKDDKALSDHLAGRGTMTATDLDDLAEKVGQLDRSQLPRLLQDARKPSFMDWAIYYWQNAILSGPITHAAYAMANGAYTLGEAALVTPVAAGIGAARAALTTGERERVLFGEAPAHVWGLVAGTPDAIIAAAKAVKTGSMTPLPREISSGVNLFTRTAPIPGVAGKIIGAPMAVASGIHTYFRFIGYRAWLEREAYSHAADQGFSPLNQEFWEKRRAYANYPTDKAMDTAIAYGDKMTFTTDLGPKGKAFKAFLGQFKIGKLVTPFIHIPANIVKAAQEGTPLAALDKSQGMRATLKGEKGSVAQDMALARIAVGSSIIGYTINSALNGEATGGGPADKQAHDEWILTHQPYSVKVGDKWVRYDRLGPAGILIGLGADLAELGHGIVKDHEYEEAANHATIAASHILVDETGLQGLADLLQAKRDPGKFWKQWAPNFVTSWMPLSSMQSQLAAEHDPYLRETYGFIDALKNKIPYVRETLLPHRDWSGMPIHNPHEMALLRQTPVNQDPVDVEIERLQFHPTRVPQEIKGVKLGEQLYDEYQSTAAPINRSLLSAMVTSPGWRDQAPFVRENRIHMAIKQARDVAAVTLQARHPEIIQQGTQQRINALERPEDQHKPLTKPRLEP